MKRPFRYATLALPVIFALGIGSAQTSLDVHAGASGANAKSSGQVVDTFGNGNLYQTPSLNGMFMNFGAGAMLTPRFGFGGEFSFKPGKSDYAGYLHRLLKRRT